MPKRKPNPSQRSIGGIVGADPEPIIRSSQSEFQVGDAVRYRRSGGVGSMDFTATVSGLVIRLNASKREVQVHSDQCNLAPFRTGDVVRLVGDKVRFASDTWEPNAKVTGLILRMGSGAELTIMPRHCHYEGLSLARE